MPADREPSGHDDALDALILRARIREFLYLEARLADEHRYQDWYELWADDALYWVPSNSDDIDPLTHVSLIHDDYSRLGDRVFRLEQPAAHSQQPRSRLRRSITNIEIQAPEEGDLWQVAANFVINELRRGLKSTYGGRAEYLLRLTDEQIALVEKKVLLLDNDMPVGNVTFLL